MTSAHKGPLNISSTQAVCSLHFQLRLDLRRSTIKRHSKVHEKETAWSDMKRFCLHVALTAVLLFCIFPSPNSGEEGCQQYNDCINKSVNNTISRWANLTVQFLTDENIVQNGTTRNITLQVCIGNNSISGPGDDAKITFFFRHGDQNYNTTESVTTCDSNKLSNWTDCGGSFKDRQAKVCCRSESNLAETCKKKCEGDWGGWALSSDTCEKGKKVGNWERRRCNVSTDVCGAQLRHQICATVSDGSGSSASKLESESRDATKNDTATEDKQTTVYIQNQTTVGTKEKPAFKWDRSKTVVTGIEVPSSLAGKPVRFVVIAKVDENIASAKPAVPTPSNNEAKNIQSLFGDEIIEIAAYDEDGKKIDISKVTVSFDVSNEENKQKFRDKVLGTAKSDNDAGRLFVKNVKHECSFHDPNDDNKPWKTDGCRASKSGGSLDCQCNHATVFAVMMSAEVVSVPTGVKVVSYVTEVTSIVFLLIAIILLAKVRNRVRGDRVKVQICLTTCLLILHFLSVVHDAALLNNTSCEIWAVLTHYFLLCSAMWMLMEGLTLLFKTMDSVMRVLSGKNAKKFAIFRYAISFSVPAIIIIISAAVGFSPNNGIHYMPVDPSYVTGSSGKYQHCWVGEDMLIGAVIIPISVIMLCSLVIAMRMFYVVYRMSSESENFKPTDQRRGTTAGELEDLEHIKAAFKATLVLLPVLGIPWFLGFFTSVKNGEVREVFMYLNVIVNGLQGVMLFFVYCVLGKEVRKAVMNSFSRKTYSITSFFEFSSSKRRMTTDMSSFNSAAHATLSTNIVDPTYDGDRRSSSSVGESPHADDQL